MLSKLFLVVVGFTIALAPAFAQKDEKAEELLNAVSEKYKEMKSFKAGFTYQAEGEEPLKGEALASGEKFNLKLAGQEIMNDGKTMATYIKETNEVNIQDFNPDDVGEFNPAKIYTAYQKGFNYKYSGESQAGGTTVENVMLIPTSDKGEVEKVDIQIDKADKSIKSWVVTNKDKRVTTYTVDQFTPNPETPVDLFSFDPKKFPGVEVIDLR